MRNRSMAMVLRGRKILMIETFRFGRTIFELPGGGIEAGETPEEAAVRELKEECGLNGTVIRPLNTMHCKNGSMEYVFLVDVPKEKEAIVGSDPEVPEGGEQSIKNVCWKELQELSEKDRAFLWSYGLMNVDGFFEEILSWGDEVSYPGK
ncbi:MAG: NUDIX hydrolase [Lachnospiraceae bacterium]|nr:NUDIX hydrolase [Lachnospiraceae bacterium]